MTKLAGLLIKCAQLLEGNQISGKEMLQASAAIAQTAIANLSSVWKISSCILFVAALLRRYEIACRDLSLEAVT